MFDVQCTPYDVRKWHFSCIRIIHFIWVSFTSYTIHWSSILHQITPH